MDKQSIDKLIERLKEATLFLLKADALAFAGLLTLASTLKLETDQVVSVAAYISSIIRYIVIVIILGLGYWTLTILMSSYEDEKNNKTLSMILKVLFGVLVLCHTGLISFTLGFVDSYLEHASK